jgi:hypothetical protein
VEVIPMAHVKLLVSVAMVIGLLAVGALCTGEAVIILDPRGAEDLLDWNKRTLSSGATWQVVDDAGDRIVKLRSESSSVSLEKWIVVDLRQTPWIEWEWKVTALPKGGHFAAPGSDDQAGQLLVTFPKALLERRKVITYLWDSSALKGTMADAPGPFFLHVRAVVVESGDSQLGQWMLEKRNLLEDFRTLFGSTPASAIGLRIQLNSQHTRSEAEAFWRTIRFTAN